MKRLLLILPSPPSNDTQRQITCTDRTASTHILTILKSHNKNQRNIKSYHGVGTKHVTFDLKNVVDIYTQHRSPTRLHSSLPRPNRRPRRTITPPTPININLQPRIRILIRPGEAHQRPRSPTPPTRNTNLRA